MLRPLPQSHKQASLLALDLSGSLAASSLPWETLSSSLPFLGTTELRPYTATIEQDGSIVASTGNCSDGVNGLDVWRYTPRWSKDGDTNTWSQSSLSSSLSVEGGVLAGPQYLSSSVAFSETVGGSSASAYVFGGMCPSDATSTDTWQGTAKYSNAMVILAHEGDSEETNNYDIGVLETRGPPIPQAGLSITPLSPTYSLSSSGNPSTQSQDFVLLGGHTQAAFINMSQVAVFSLPQQSWSFMPVRQPTDAKTDLARRQAIEVTPRSGHTAVLSESGDRIVLFGGWVGDVNTPATPQLAVLQLGDGYGGSGDWSWTVPEDSSHGLSSGSGIYGHGAVMLPGGVMMVAGGYEIPSTSTRRLKRSAQIGSTRTLFYNVTSNTWLSSYKLPVNFDQSQSQGSGPLSTKSQKVGLGAGLGFGAAILVSVVLLYIWYSKRVKRAREDRDRALLIHSSDGSSMGQIEQPFLESGGIDGRGDDDFALGRSWSGDAQNNNAYPRPPPMQHTTGMFVNVPSPTRGLRRGVAGKSYQYQPAPRFDDNRLSRASGGIHPIAEHENEDEVLSIKSDREQLDDAEAKLKEIERVLTTADPFTDLTPNPLGSHPVSPVAGAANTMWRVAPGASGTAVPARKPVPSVEETANWTVAPGADNDGQSSSDDRTSSTLSERSQRSEGSYNSITRTMSTRTGAILSAALQAQRRSLVLDTATTQERSHTMSTDASYVQTRARSSTNGSVTPGAPEPVDRDSFMTAKTNFVLLQSEGEALLGGRPMADRDDPYQRALAAHPSTQLNAQASSSYRIPSTITARKRQGWMGSLRRALNVVSLGERSFSLTGNMEQYHDDPRSSSSSPTKEHRDKMATAPRRAVSDGGALLRQKRGQSDWDEKAWPPYRDSEEDWGEPKPSVDKARVEEDWDVEGAANQRDFQVMFTVPKSRLRVVNDDMDRASLRSASDGALSRNGSTKDLRREESFKALRARMEEQRLLLPSTEEEREEGEKEKEKVS